MEGTVAVAVEAGLPVITEPPAPEDRPPACQQGTVTLRIETDDQKRCMKALQPRYWGSPQWQEDYARRTHIEGFFGCFQNPEIGSINGETHQHRGLALTTIIFSMAAAISNAHNLRTWHAKTGKGDPNHPLLKPDYAFHGFKELSAEEARAIDIEQATKQEEQADKAKVIAIGQSDGSSIDAEPAA